MFFKKKSKEKTMRKVKEYLDEMYGTDNIDLWNEDTYAILIGKAIIKIITREYGDKNTMVSCYCDLVYKAQLDHELVKYLIKENANHCFGSFFINEENTIYFCYTLLGETIQKQDLQIVLECISYVSNENAKIIIEKYGGKTSLEVYSEYLRANDNNNIQSSAGILSEFEAPMLN